MDQTKRAGFGLGPYRTPYCIMFGKRFKYPIKVGGHRLLKKADQKDLKHLHFHLCPAIGLQPLPRRDTGLRKPLEADKG